MFFSPASLTCFFSPKIEEDPMRCGSLGVGIALNRGVRVEAEPDQENSIVVNGEVWDFPTVRFVADRLGFRGKIAIEMDLPAGCGFGMSGASALASALAIDEALNINRTFHDLADLAHEAEVRSRTGLGDVVTQSFGGVVVRKSASCPSKCKIDRFLWRLELDLLVIGDLPTDGVLSEFSLREISKIGRYCLKEFLRKPSVENLFKISKEFAVKTGLVEVDPVLMDAIEAVESSGGMASMVMLGRAVFALRGGCLREFDGVYLKAEVDHCGVRLLG